MLTFIIVFFVFEVIATIQSIRSKGKIVPMENALQNANIKDIFYAYSPKFSNNELVAFMIELINTGAMHISKGDKGYTLNTRHTLKESTSFRATFIEDFFGEKNEFILDDSHEKLREVATNIIRKLEKEEHLRKLTTFCAIYCFTTTLPIVIVGLSKQLNGIFMNTYSTLLLFAIIIAAAVTTFFYASKSILKTNRRSYTICFGVILALLIGILLFMIFKKNIYAIFALIIIFPTSLLQLIGDLNDTFFRKNEAFCRAASIKKYLEEFRDNKKSNEVKNNLSSYALNTNNPDNIDKRLIPYACVLNMWDLDMDSNIKEFAQECVRILDVKFDRENVIA